MGVLICFSFVLFVPIVLSYSENPFEYSGFIEVNETTNTNLYYCLFPSLDGNKKAPTILWLNGGPGESSIGTGLFELLGPYRVNEELELVKNPYTWNLHYNLLFVDQPAGVGFSYTDPEGYVYFIEQSSSQLYTFILKFFDMYPEYQENDLFIGGESYGGKWVPAFGHEIARQGLKFPLKGLLLLNPFTDPIHVYEKCSDSLYGFGLINEVSKSEMEKYCVDMVNSVQNGSLVQSWEIFNTVVGDYIPKITGGVNSMNILVDEGFYDFGLTDKYVNLASTRDLMHTGTHVFNHSSDVVYQNFRKDFSRSVIDDVVEALDDLKIKVLFLSGEFDWLCGVMATENAIRHMQWSGQEKFNSLPYTPIIKSEKTTKKKSSIGYSMEYENLKFVVVRNAGHLSPLDQSENDLQIISDFVDNFFL